MLFLRWAGTVIDLILLGSGVFLLAELSNAAWRVGVTIGIVGVMAYYPITEGIWGKTLGKAATGLMVVDENGDPPGIGKACIRTLARLVEVNPFLLGGLPAALVVGLTPTRQRLGDLFANTYVVRVRELAKPSVARVFD
jgi:uncharacterized RDD family membrane protein YckC